MKGPVGKGKAGLLLALLLTALPAAAKVSAPEAELLRSTLTPLGGERAGNRDGSIPPWSGGLTQAPACYQGTGHRYCDPFADDRPLFTITAANFGPYRDQLSAGQQAMLAKYPDSYRLPVYATRRSAGYADFVNEASYRNALNAELGSDGQTLLNASVGIPFPIPKTGIEPVWNHRLRYRGPGARRWNNQAAVTAGGEFNLVKMREDVRYAYAQREAVPSSPANALSDFVQLVMQPPRLAGQLTLIRETLDPKAPSRAWQYNPGQRRVRPAPNVGYDNPGTGADNLRTSDQADSFSGPGDRYSWKIVGKKEMLVPYNAYRLHSDQVRYQDILRRGHINQELARYELHRVWVVEGLLKPGVTHVYGRRVFYLDEDSWQILLADIYDRSGELWRWQETHPLQAYDQPFLLPGLETIYDLQGGRYLAQGMNNEDPETVGQSFAPDYFEPSKVQRQATK